MAKAKNIKSPKAEPQKIKTGGIYFADEINCQIKVDTNAEEGKKLISCVNLFDGQELGEGGVQPTGTIEISENGTYDVVQYAEASVNVPVPEPPTETLTITENGEYDVVEYATANVNVVVPRPVCTQCFVENAPHDIYSLTLKSHNLGNEHRSYVEQAIANGSYCYDIYMTDLDYYLDFSMDGTRRFQYYHENHGRRFYCVNNASGTDIQCKTVIPDTQEVHVSFKNDPNYPDTFYIEIKFINTTGDISSATFGSFEPAQNHSYTGYLCFYED